MAFFHGQFTGTTVADSKGSTRHVAPSVSALALAATENGTWFAGGGHFGIWRQDTIRYTGAAGYGSINMDYYGTGGELSGRPVEFNTEAFIFIQELQFRLWESPFFAGAGYTLLDTQNVFDTSSLIPIPGLPDINFDLRSAGLSLMLNYDSRDNLFTPSSGLDAAIKVGLYGDTWGGDDDFTKYSAYAKYYHCLGDKWVLGLRGDARAVDGC